MALEGILRSDIVNFLLNHPAFQVENGRKAILLEAELQSLLPDLELSGSPREFVTLLVDRLERFGALESGELALVALLQTAAAQVGKEGKAQVRNLRERLITPPELGEAACPYRGLEIFREQDTALFFGREDVIETLRQKVTQQPFVALIGASGSGKSSVVYAGLLPQLRKQPGQLIATFRPGAEPFRAVAAAALPLLEPNLTETDRLIELRKLADAVMQTQLSLSDIIERILQKAPPAPRLLLFADQFEELYTVCPAGTNRQRFLDAMIQTCEVFNTSQVSWLLTLRADFLSHVLDYSPFAKLLKTYPPEFLDRMAEEQLRAVIERPARHAGVTLEAGLSDHILREVGQEPGNLPLLEFALTALWQRMAGRSLTHAAYEAIGGVQQALTRHADAVLAEFATPDAQAQVRRILVQLVSPGAGTEDTRQVATRAQVPDWNVVQRLADRRLVVTGRQEESDAETVEVVHEALIRHWQPLREWMKADRAFRVWQNSLRHAIKSWMQTGRDNDALLRGALLAEAEHWLEQRHRELSKDEQTFIELGLQFRNQELAEREAQRQRELETAKTLAKEQQQRAEERTQAAKKLRRWLVVAAMAALIAIVAASAAFYGFKQANLNAQNARQQAELAQKNAELANKQKEIAQKASNDAKVSEQNALRNQSLTLTALAQREVEKGNIVNGILLALEALPQGVSPRPYVFEAHNLLYEAVSYLQTPIMIIQGHEANVWSVIFSPDGKRFVTTSWDRTARIWNSKTGQQLVKFEGHEDGIWSAVFSSDGRRVVTASADQTARIWNANTGQQIAKLQGHIACINYATFSHDGKKVVTVSDDHTSRVWDAKTGKQLLLLEGHQDTVNHATFSPDGNWIITISGKALRGYLSDKRATDMTARLWNVKTGRQVMVLKGHKDDIHYAAFSPDGQRVVTASSDNTARVWDVNTGKQFAVMQQHEGPVNYAVFSPDGQKVVTASDDKTARLWDGG